MDGGIGSSFYLRTLGGLSLRSGSRDGPEVLAASKPVTVLALLAARPEYTARREYVAELLWPGADHRRARRSLRQALFYISKRAGSTPIEADDSHLTLDPTRIRTDLWEFDRALERKDFQRAVDLHGGAFLAGYERRAGTELEHWIEAENERVLAGLEVALSRLIAEALDRDDTDAAVKYAERYAQLNPLDESAQVALVRALHAAGRDVDALRAYQSYRTLLREALGGEPSRELTRRIQDVRAEVVEGAIRRSAGGAGRPAPRTREGAAPDARIRRLMRRAMLAGAALGGVAVLLILGAVLFTWGALSGGSPEATPFADLSGSVVGELGGPETRRAEVILERDVAEVRPIDEKADRMPTPAPNGRWTALWVPTPRGWNLALEDVATGEVRVLTDDPHDEEPQDWSPDSRYILFRYGTLLDGGRDYTHRLGVYDTRTDRRWRLTRNMDAFREAAGVWSPDGTRIAFVADPDGNSDIFVVNVDGSGLRNVSAHPGSDWFPSWSPDGRRIAFSSDRSGTWNLFITDLAGGAPRQVTRGPGSELAAVWVKRTTLVYVSSEPDSGTGDLWAVHLPTGERQRLTDRGDMRRLLIERTYPATERWIERIAIKPQPTAVSPGQNLELSVEASDPEGRPVPEIGTPVRWTVEDPTVLAHLGDGVFRVEENGSTRLIADLAGWRADTVTVASRPLEVRALEPVLQEDWTGGIVPERWIVFGDPLPYSRATGGPEGAGVFVNNGDSHYPSGVVTRRDFPLDGSLTIEAWGRLAFTGHLYQSLSIALTARTPPPDSAEWYSLQPILRMHLDGPANYRPARVSLTMSSRSLSIPLPPEPGEWHRYALQIEPDGRVMIMIDGRLHWRSAGRLPPESLARGRVVLAGRSFNTEIMHGRVAVYRGAKYRIANGE